jgi:cell division protein FtsZ
MSKTRKASDTEPPTGRRFRLRVLGIGSAGGNTITYINRARAEQPQLLAGAELVAINTDRQLLDLTEATDRIQLGDNITHGLGAGGDPEIGARAAQATTDRLKTAVEHAQIVFLTAGLAGGTGGGAAPIIARIAREAGALVLAVVTLPFSFEGERRRQAALTALDQLKHHANAVICIPNDKLLKVLGENTTAREALDRCDALIATAAQAVWQLVSRKGLINLDFADLQALLGNRHAEGVLAYGEASGENRVKEAVDTLLKSPWLDGDQALARTEGLLVSILGGPDLSLGDVQKIVEPITRHAPRAQVSMGAAIDEAYAGRLAVTVIAATNVTGRKPVDAKPVAVAGPDKRGPADEPRAASAATETIKPLGKKDAPKLRQETLPLDNVSRGRFDKSEPTLYDGQDLDVPTFLRRGVTLPH